MKMSSHVCAVAVALVCGDAMAAMAVCTGNGLSAAQLRSLLPGNTVCVPTLTVPTMTWQELHDGGPNSGALIDYKRGPADPGDPSETVGSWSITESAPGASGGTITYDYGGSDKYTFTVYGSGIVGTNHSFCGAGPVIQARVKSGGGAC
jgi:hypothetical protein